MEAAMNTQSADLLVLGVPESLKRRHGGALHRFRGSFDEAVRYATRELPAALLPYAAIRTGDGRWLEGAQIRSFQPAEACG
jgi:hypothetical protein